MLIDYSADKVTFVSSTLLAWPGTPSPHALSAAFAAQVNSRSTALSVPRPPGFSGSTLAVAEKERTEAQGAGVIPQKSALSCLGVDAKDSTRGGTPTNALPAAEACSLPLCARPIAARKCVEQSRLRESRKTNQSYPCTLAID